MGLNLSKLVNIELEIIHFDALESQVLIIDGYDYLLNILSRTGKFDNPIFDKLGNPASHFIYVFNHIIELLEHKIRPIFVFDNIDLKNINPLINSKILKLIMNFKKMKNESNNDFQQNINNELIKEYKEIIEEVIYFINICGMPAFFSPSNIPSLTTTFIQKKKASGVISNDLNFLLFKVPVLYRKLDFNNNTIQRIQLDDVLKVYDIKFDQFLEINILMGNDYFPESRIKGFGPKNALKAIKEHGSLENLISKNIIEKFEFQHIKDFFYNRISEDIPVEFQNPDRNKLKEFFIKKNLKNKIDNEALLHISRVYRELWIKQKKIDQFF
ncbi:MAG: hypothetical protein ACTSPY_03785 [Candidatus Helarchaeota archaeon]